MNSIDLVDTIVNVVCRVERPRMLIVQPDGIQTEFCDFHGLAALSSQQGRLIQDKQTWVPIIVSPLTSVFVSSPVHENTPHFHIHRLSLPQFLGEFSIGERPP